MRSSDARPLAFALAASLAAASWASQARAQQQAQGFAVDRLYQAAPGGGWIVMDGLDMRGGLGGAAQVSGGYAHDPLRVTDGARTLPVVADLATAGVAIAVTYDRYRLYANFSSPLVMKGESGTVGGYAFAAPSFDLTSHPDAVSDLRLGFDARLLGDAKAPFRLGAGAQIYIPNDDSADYLTDGTYHGMLRLLFAGDFPGFTYAGQVGVHIRPVDDHPVPGSPEGSELLFGAAAGPRFRVDRSGETVVIVGPEVYGESAFRSLFGATSTGVEGLLTGRIEGTGDDGQQVQAKVGVGAGLDARFGAPAWRFEVAVSLFDHSTDTDGDGVFDSKDACPRTPGVKTTDRKTSGCPLDRDADGVLDTDDACPDEAGPRTGDLQTSGCPAAVEGPPAR